jgi:hypothetical protein
MSQHCQNSGRTVHCVNLDPAAEELLLAVARPIPSRGVCDHWGRYECSIDVRELVSVEDVMAEMNLGPNGGLVYAMEYLVENIDWLQASCCLARRRGRYFQSSFWNRDLYA